MKGEAEARSHDVCKCNDHYRNLTSSKPLHQKKKAKESEWRRGSREPLSGPQVNGVGRKLAPKVKMRGKAEHCSAREKKKKTFSRCVIWA